MTGNYHESPLLYLPPPQGHRNHPPRSAARTGLRPSPPRQTSRAEDPRPPAARAHPPARRESLHFRRPLTATRRLSSPTPHPNQLARQRLHDVEDVLCWVASQSTLFDTARVGVSCFVPDHAMRADPRVSSSKADAADFPPAVASLACEGDIFSPEALALAERLDDRRRRVLGRNLEGVHHGFDKGARRGTREWERREEAYELAIQILKDGLKV